MDCPQRGRPVTPVVVVTGECTDLSREPHYTILVVSTYTRRGGLWCSGQINILLVVCLGFTPCKMFYGSLTRSSDTPVVFVPPRLFNSVGPPRVPPDS